MGCSSHWYRLSIPPASISHFPSLFRRLSRIFSHAYFHHLEAFSLSESETSLYARFVALCERYELLGPQLLGIPRDVVGTIGQPSESESEEEQEKDEEEEDEEEESEEDEDEDEDDESGAGSGSRGRGGDKDGAGVNGGGDTREKRTRSLDRDLINTSVDIPSRQKGSDGSPKQSITKPITSASSPKAVTENISPEKSKLQSTEESSPMPPVKTLSRGTQGRGKQPRGTMLWNSDSGIGVAGVPSTPALSNVQGQGMSSTRSHSDSSDGNDSGLEIGAGGQLERTESSQTAILLTGDHDEEKEQDGTPGAADGETSAHLSTPESETNENTDTPREEQSKEFSTHQNLEPKTEMDSSVETQSDAIVSGSSTEAKVDQDEQDSENSSSGDGHGDHLETTTDQAIDAKDATELQDSSTVDAAISPDSDAATNATDATDSMAPDSKPDQPQAQSHADSQAHLNPTPNHMGSKGRSPNRKKGKGNGGRK